MPIREYKCTKCGDTTEVIQKINEKPLEVCSKCGGKLEKLISNSSFVLKGSGWYKTDYGSGSKPSSSSPAAAHHHSTEKSDAAVSTAAAPSCSCGTGGSCTSDSTKK
ncbi:MAG: zinc ribbon domain-containing protein [Candidatus Acididesulfobacter guangdongensis]|uniref:Zinc ribbon domain-containing protein n=1 Tax=Acididesulfobacter guangdongensis TaxID=2597225 RepID=A0A519BJ78_ACIG2|nr:MAG: zinc ribbon domain-containing protein [Candidatus Acididesulfobacter guangdongensis]